MNQNIGTIGMKAKKKRIATRADAENSKMQRSNSLKVESEEIDQVSVPLKNSAKYGAKKV